MIKKPEEVLIGNMDARVWAREFIKIIKKKPSIPTDEGTMIGWFANAIMAGYDTARSKDKQELERLEHKIKSYELIMETMQLCQSYLRKD